MLAAVARPVARVTTVGAFLDDEAQQVSPHYAGFLETMQRCRERGGRLAAVELTSEALGLGFARAWPWRIGVFTNLSHDHLDVHQSLEHYLACKAQLFMALPEGGVAVLNAFDANAELIREVLPAGVELLPYGLPSRGTAWTQPLLTASQVVPSLSGTRIRLAASARFPELPQEMHIRAIGEIFAENALAALAAALVASVPVKLAVRALAETTPPAGRFEIVSEAPCVVVDYAHTPDALVRTLATARTLCAGRLTLVFGAGGQRDRAKRPLLGAAARAADRIVLTSDNPRDEDPLAIMAHVSEGIGAHANVLKEPNRARAIELALEGATSRDLVLIAGKGHERTQEQAGKKLPFSDVAIVRRLLSK